MGIVEEDIARVRAATDFIAVAAEHIALKRVGRQFQGLCPFHSEKSPSFSINPEKGVYYCYGCQASGDVISFVRELEKLDFAQAVERLAAKANITLRYDSEAAGKDRIKRAKLVEAMEGAVVWYHDRLLKSPDAGPARSYLRSRGYDGQAIRQFRIGWAPDGWDTLCKALRLPTDVAKDTGLGYTNKVGKVNDFFQKRILFPIFDQSGAPVAFGGRKMPEAEGPKYKNSSETKLYSKSRTLYGLNWAKANIVETGEVIVCEGYTDVIGFHRAGLPRAVATCGTALADEHFRILKNYARRIVLGYDADNAGQNAAAKFFAWEKQYEIDLYVVVLPPGSDPGDVAREDPQALHGAVANAKPFLAFRVDRVMNSASLSTPEGRARAYDAAATVIMEHPSPIVREQYLVEVAARCQVSEDMMARTLAAPSTAAGALPSKPGKGQRTQGAPEQTFATRPQPKASSVATRSDGPGRLIANEDPGAGWSELPSSEPPFDDRGWQPSNRLSQRPQFGATSTPKTRPSRTQGRATSPALRGRTSEQRSRLAEEEALRWAVHDPDRVLMWLHPVLFADPVHVRSVELLLEHGEVLAIADAVLGAEQGIDARSEVTSERNRPDGDQHDDAALDRKAVQCLRRFAVTELLTEDVDDALALVVSNASARVLATIMSMRADAHPEEQAAVGTVKLLQMALHEPSTRVAALNQLVPWLSSWDAQRKQGAQESAEPEAAPMTESN